MLNKIYQGNQEQNGSGLNLKFKKSSGALEIDFLTALTAQISALQNMMSSTLSRMASDNISLNLMQFNNHYLCVRSVMEVIIVHIYVVRTLTM